MDQQRLEERKKHWLALFRQAKAETDKRKQNQIIDELNRKVRKDPACMRAIERESDPRPGSNKKIDVETLEFVAFMKPDLRPPR